MTKYFLFLWLPLLTIACKQNPDKNERTEEIKKNTTIRLYSKTVADSFSIFVNLPNDYNPQHKEKYPVVYLLDANLYFDIIATIFNKYSGVGLAPAVILVGIGYKDFPTMDSLRNKDDTYPAAIPEYEMSVSGGADKFLAFINNELISHVDKEYQTDTLKRILMGHSLGGYFTVYALLQDLLGKSDNFSSYISASPSIHYNKYYLLNQLKETAPQKNRGKKIKAYVTYGGLEDDENTGDSSMIKLTGLCSQLSKLLSEKQSGYITFKSDIYSNLGHMDTQLPTFIKGLQWTLSEDK
ncbi:MAG: alpha/beta hydrolase [Chitinophagaceae bacterium]|nr:alpha/beta hydrolase [Chitinophagaceae bacterium]